MNLIPAFQPPSSRLGSRHTSEHNRLAALLACSHTPHTSIPNFGRCLPSAGNDDVPPAIPSIDSLPSRSLKRVHLHTIDFLDEGEDDSNNNTGGNDLQTTKQIRISQPSSSGQNKKPGIELFDGALSWPGLVPKTVNTSTGPSLTNTSLTASLGAASAGQSNSSNALPAPILAPVTSISKAKSAPPSLGELLRQADQQTVMDRHATKPRKNKETPANTSTSNHVPSSSGSSRANNEKKSSSSSSAMSLSSNEMAFSGDDFLGIDRICRNAGGTNAGLEAFRKNINKLPETSRVGIGLVFRDLSTNHSSMSVRYCTPSARCSIWHCACDKIIRAAYLSSAEHLLGAVVVTTEKDDQAVTYFLPLTHCVEPVDENSQSFLSDTTTTATPFPLKCGTTLRQRWNVFQWLLTLPSLRKVVYNVQIATMPLHKCLRRLSCHSTLPNLFDPRLAVYLLNPDVAEEDLEVYSLLRNGEQPVGGDVRGLGRFSRVVDRLSSELLGLMLLHDQLLHQMEEGGLMALFRDIEMPLAFILSTMEQCGVVVDAESLSREGERLKKDVDKIEKRIVEISGRQFNVASPEQLAKVLFEELRIQKPTDDNPASARISNNGVSGTITVGTAKKKFPSTSEEELQKLRHLHPIIDMVLQYRGLAKLLTTYIEGLRPLLVHNKARSDSAEVAIHANWNQTSVRTGRLSCSKPNLQNIPNAQTIADEDYNMRTLFIAHTGRTFVGADYSQIEMRVLAHLCQDANLCGLFRREGDIYSLLAGRIFSKASDAVTTDERNKAKVICLGVLYGMGAASTAAKLNLETAAAAKIVQSFFSNFSQVKLWIQRIKSQAKQFKLVRTLLGRLRHLPDIVSDDSSAVATAERQAVNTVIQGTASDLIKLAMVLSFQQLATAEEVRLVMQIHDELIFEVPNDPQFLSSFTENLRRIMEKEVVESMHLQVPLIANISVGEKWGEMQPWVST
eukprot:gene1512-1647_t